MKFKIGQEVTPTKRHFDVVFGAMQPIDIPEFGKIYTVAGYPLSEKDYVPEYLQRMMQLEEKSPTKVYHENFFEAVLPAEAIEEALEQTVY